MSKQTSNLVQASHSHSQEVLEHQMPIFRHLWLPIFLEQVFGMFLGNVDVFMLSQYSDASVAAVGVANQLINTGLMVLGIASLGSAIQLLQLGGTGDKKTLQSIIRHAVYLNVIISSLLALVFIVFGRVFLAWIQTPPDLIDAGYTYLSIVAFSLVFQSIMTSMAAVFKSLTFVKSISLITAIVNILGIIGKYIVIMTPYTFLGEGIRGVAITTLLTRIVGAALTIGVFFKLRPDFRNTFNTLRLRRHRVESILKLGFPSALENISYTMSQTIITAIIASFGTLVVTSKIYTQNITALVFTIAASISQANQIITGRLIGLKHKMEAREYTIELLKRSLLVGIGLSIIIALLTGYIVTILTDNVELQESVKLLVWLSVLLEPARLANEILVGALNTAGDVKFPTYLTIGLTFLITIPLSYLLGVHFNFGLVGVWVAFILDEWTKASILFMRWYRGSWQEIHIFE